MSDYAIIAVILAVAVEHLQQIVAEAVEIIVGVSAGRVAATVTNHIRSYNSITPVREIVNLF